MEKKDKIEGGEGNPFTVPDNYFRDLPGEVWKRIEREKIGAPRTDAREIPLHRQTWFRISLTAAAACLLAIVLFRPFGPTGEEEELTVQAETAYQYFLENPEAFDYIDILEIAPGLWADDNSALYNLELEEEALEEYMDEEFQDIDEETIKELL